MYVNVYVYEFRCCHWHRNESESKGHTSGRIFCHSPPPYIQEQLVVLVTAFVTGHYSLASFLFAHGAPRAQPFVKLWDTSPSVPHGVGATVCCPEIKSLNWKNEILQERPSGVFNSAAFRWVDSAVDSTYSTLKKHKFYSPKVSGKQCKIKQRSKLTKYAQKDITPCDTSRQYFSLITLCASLILSYSVLSHSREAAKASVETFVHHCESRA